MKKLVVLLGLVMFVATSAFAVVDPDPDMMGIYWDTNADMPCTGIAYVPTNMYIILTNPTSDHINGFECSYDIDATPAPYLLSAAFANPNALDVAAGFQNFIVGFGSPTTCTEATLLVTISVLNAGAPSLGFYLHDAVPSSVSNGLPAVVIDNVIYSVGTSTLPGTLNAFMGADCGVVATEEASWDSVKSLYR